MSKISDAPALEAGGVPTLWRAHGERYEYLALAPRGRGVHRLAVAQFYRGEPDGSQPSGWVVSGASSDHYSDRIPDEADALRFLRAVAHAEAALSRRYSGVYPEVPPVAHEVILRERPDLKRLSQTP